MTDKPISTRAHGVLDYVTGATLLLAPNLLGTQNARSAPLARLAGAAAAAYSLCTDYELGVRRVIPMPIHLKLDAGSGALLALAPWLLGDARRGIRFWLPQAAIGAMEIGVAALSQTEPSRKA
jgi:hypothetical protein